MSIPKFVMHDKATAAIICLWKPETHSVLVQTLITGKQDYFLKNSLILVFI